MNGEPIDASGGLPDGTKFDGVAGLQKALLSRPEVFAATFTEKLLTYALGRGVEYYDAPAVRKIVREAGQERIPVLVVHSGNRQQHTVSDEEVTMIITKKALPRRTFLRGVGADAGAATAGCHGAVDDRAGGDTRPIRCAAWALSTCRWARTLPQWTPAGRGQAHASCRPHCNRSRR